MEYAEFTIGYRFMREAAVSQATACLGFRSERWIEENIPLVQYDKIIYDFIVSTTWCIHVTENVAVYEVNGQWQRIIEKQQNNQ